VAIDEEDVRSIIAGMFDANRVLTEIALDVRLIREELVENDGKEDEDAG